MKNTDAIAKRISSHRYRLKLTQAALAEHIGVSVGAVRAWEKGASAPRLTNARQLSELFDAPISDFSFENSPDFAKITPDMTNSPFKS